MTRGGRMLAIGLVGVGALAGGAAWLHLPSSQSPFAHLHGGQQSAEPAAASVLETAARDAVAPLGNRWDEQAFAETVSVYTAVHRELQWPGVLPPEVVSYGAEAQQQFELFLPEQGFSEPGPVFVFVPGNGLGGGEFVVPGSDGLIHRHIGKLAATFGGIGVTMNYRNGTTASLQSGAEDLRLVLRWLKANIAEYGGDPNTLVVLANSEGATRTAAYLFNESWQLPSGLGVAAAILSSGLFGALAPEIEAMTINYRGERVPLALWGAEFDPPEFTAGIADLHEILCRKYDGCPWFSQHHGHNHLSALLSLGTAETDVLNAFIRFYHTVR